MDVFEAVRTVLAVRKYDDKPVPEDTILEILEAGRLSASSMNGQPWHFVVVQDRETLKKIGELESHGPYISQASLAIVVALDKSPYAVSDASRAIQSMVLTAWSRGIGSNWVGFHGLEAIGALVGVPDTLDVLAVLPFGYPTEDIGQGKKNRKSLGEVASRERFGEAFE